MMLLRLILLMTSCFCIASAVLSGKELKRREAGFDSYGPPPRPAPQYGPPPQHIPHREYGVPQQIPFREYGPPALKYGPPKLKFVGGGGGSSSSNGIYEQIKTHFGVPKPFYGPPHIPHQPAAEYGAPKPAYGPPAPHYGPPPAQQFGPPPPQQYGPPPQPAAQYGPPLKLQHRPAPQYGPPPPNPQFSKPPVLAQPLPAPHPAQLFKPHYQPATSYGPPASGPLNLPPKPVYETPPNYGPPPLPINLPGPQSANFNRVPETTIILSGPGGQQLPSGPGGGPLKQVQIQIDASGHTHSISGSQAPFHTACDGWKPISAPTGAYIEQNHIETQGGYSHVDQGHAHGLSQSQSQSQSIATQYSIGGASNSGSIVDGLSDEQLVAVALQSEGGSAGGNGPTGDGHLNTLNSEALQISVGSIDDSYSKPPVDSFAPGSVHAQKYQTIGGNQLSQGPGLNYGPPPPPPPQFAAQTSSHAQSQAQSFSHSNVNIHYGLPSGNPQPFPQHGAGHPKAPVAYRPPVPTGLLESIGATVQHLDQFGVKPPQQAPTYIPPATNEIALSGPPSAPPAIYGAPLNLPQPPAQIVVEQQQLPQPQPGPNFAHRQPAQLPEFGPVPLPQPHYLPPPPQQFLLDRPPALTNIHQQQQQHHQQQQHAQSSFSSSSQYVHSQALPLSQQAPRFNQQAVLASGLHLQQQQQQQQQQQPLLVVHDCGQGPNLVSSPGYQVQKYPQFGSVSAASPGAYNAIAQSVPVAEQHTQFLAGPADSYGPPASGNDLNFDHSGYASQKSAVAALPDGTDPQELQGLEGLDVISAQKSQSIQLGNGPVQPTQNFQVQFGSSLNTVGGGAGGSHGGVAALGEQGANHEEILSQGLLQSILTAIEQPQSSSSLPQNHKAQSRSDEDHNEQHEESVEEQESQQHEASNRVEVRVLPDAEDKESNLHSEGHEAEPIVAAEVEEEAKH